jgi:DNA-binding GntR family transcriptional regulator
MKPNMGSTPVNPLARNALRHDVVVCLLSSIFQGELPAETRLIIRKLAEQMGISATPIREALVELESIGVVQFTHNRGAVVKPFGPQQIREIYHLRRILESEAARSACGRIDSRQLEHLAESIRQQLTSDRVDTEQWGQEVMALDRETHAVIAGNCGNARLADEVRRYDSLLQTIREIVGNRQQMLHRSLEDHLAIIETLLSNDANRAAEAVSRHIDSSAAAVLAIMFEGK